MKTALAMVVLAVVACHGKGASTGPAKVATPKEVTDGARAAIEQWRQAYEVRSPEVLGKLYVHGGETMLVQDGVPTLGWPAIEPLLRDRLTRAKDIHVKLKDVQVTALSEDTVYAVASISREVSDGVTNVAENGAVTLVLRNEGGAWHILAEHYSRRQG
jgi:hypothetical protein